MKREDIINSPLIGQLALKLVETNTVFKNELKALAQDIAAEIESASTNPNCSCRSKVIAYTEEHTGTVGDFIFEFTVREGLLEQVTDILKELSKTIIRPEQDASGKVAKTTIAGWSDFVRGVQEAGLSYRQMSTSIVGDDVYVFFI